MTDPSNQSDLLTLDPSITSAMVEAADALTPIDYDAVIAAMEAQVGQDDLDEVGAGTVVPATPAQAIAHGNQLRLEKTYVGVGYCLRTVRDNEFRVPALYPTAEIAYEQAFGKHPETDPKAFPRGVVGYHLNDRDGHVWESVGGGYCLTTDYGGAGYVHLAPIAALAAWCGGRLVGWAEGLNGVDVWPNPTKPKPKPVVDLSIANKIRLLHAAERAAKTNGRQHRVDTIAAWIERLEKHQTGGAK